MATKISQWLLKTNAFDMMDKVGGAFAKVNKLADQATGAWDKMTGGSKKLGSSVDELNAKLDTLRLKKRSALSTDEVGQLNQEIRQTEMEIRKLDQLPGKSFFGNLDMGVGMVKNLAASLGLVLSLQAGLSFAGDVVEVTGKYERFGAVLQNSLGKAEAVKSLQNISEFAAKTPFQIDELTDSYVKLTNRGMRPSNEAMTLMGDIASSQGKSFLQLTEGVLDAATGEFERLKEFGISGSKSGNQITLAFKGLTQTIQNTPEEINKALMAFGRMNGVAGAMESIAATTEGKISNLGDKYDMVKLRFGLAFKTGMESGFLFIDGLLDKLTGLADWMDKNQASIGLFFKMILVGAGYMALLAVQTWLVTAPFNVWLYAGMAVAAALLYLYQKVDVVRGAIDALVVVVETSIKAWVGFWNIILSIFEGIGNLLSGEWDFSSLDKSITDQASLFLEGGKKAKEAYIKGFNSAYQDNTWDIYKNPFEKVLDGVPGAANKFLGGGGEGAQQGDSTMTQAVTNITNQDQGQKNYVINIANLVGIGNYTDNSGKPRQAAERAGDMTLDELTRALNGANLALQ